MQISQYVQKHKDEIAVIVRNFHAESIGEYDNGFNSETVMEAILGADPKNAYLLTFDDKCEGLIFGTRMRSPTSGKTMYQEIIWYVNPDFRGNGMWLFNEVQKRLKEDGVGIIIMAVMENSKTEKLKSLYTRLGFRPMETHYVKEL